jgi:hypothetical protein
MQNTGPGSPEKKKKKALCLCVTAMIALLNRRNLRHRFEIVTVPPSFVFADYV